MMKGGGECIIREINKKKFGDSDKESQVKKQMKFQRKKKGVAKESKCVGNRCGEGTEKRRKQGR
jgi:hypothetical protein